MQRPGVVAHLPKVPLMTVALGCQGADLPEGSGLPRLEKSLSGGLGLQREEAVLGPHLQTGHRWTDLVLRVSCVMDKDTVGGSDTLNGDFLSGCGAWPASH